MIRVGGGAHFQEIHPNIVILFFYLCVSYRRAAQASNCNFIHNSKKKKLCMKNPYKEEVL